MRSASVGALISPFFASYSLTSSSACITAYTTSHDGMITPAARSISYGTASL